MPGSDPWKSCQVYMEDAGRGGSNPVWVVRRDCEGGVCGAAQVLQSDLAEQQKAATLCEMQKIEEKIRNNKQIIQNIENQTEEARSPEKLYQEASKYKLENIDLEYSLNLLTNAYNKLIRQSSWQARRECLNTPVNPFLIDNTAGFTGEKRSRSKSPVVHDDTSPAVRDVSRYIEENNKPVAPVAWHCTDEENNACNETFNWLSGLQREITEAGVIGFDVCDALRIDKHVYMEWCRRYRRDDRGIKFRKATFYLKVAITKWKINGRKMQPQNLDEWVTEQDKKTGEVGRRVEYPWTFKHENIVQDTGRWLRDVKTDADARGLPDFHDHDALRIDRHVLLDWSTRLKEGNRGITFRKSSRYIRQAIEKWRRKGTNVQPQTLDEWVAEQDEENREPGYVKEKTEEGDIIFVRKTDKKKFLYAPTDPAFNAAVENVNRGAGGAARA